MSSAQPSPADAPLQILVEARGRLVLVKIEGVVEADMAGRLTTALQEATQLHPRVLAVDVSGLSFVSSSGLGALVAAHVSCQKNGTRMVLVNPRPLILEILNVTRLSSLIEIVDSVEEAERIARE